MALDAAAEVAKKKQQRDWWTTTVRQMWPQEAAKLRQEMVDSRNRLFDRFRQLPDGIELTNALHRLTDLQFAFAHYGGVRRGYTVARALAKLSHSDAVGKAQARIMELILQRADWTTKRIFAALDDEDIPLIYLGGMHKEEKETVRRPQYWSDVTEDGAYKMFVSRLRNKVSKIARLQSWEKIMKRHTKLRKS